MIRGKKNRRHARYLYEGRFASRLNTSTVSYFIPKYKLFDGWWQSFAGSTNHILLGESMSVTHAAMDSSANKHKWTSLEHDVFKNTHIICA